jgi:hypothetical protein
MFQTCNLAEAPGRPDPRLVRSDLCAQLAPLDRYGLTGFSSALVDAARALLGASRRAATGCANC